jgi:hypothetical protein
MLDVAVAEIGLQRPRVVALVGKRVAAGMPEHMRMGLEGESGRPARTFDHPGEACGSAFGSRRGTSAHLG